MDKDIDVAFRISNPNHDFDVICDSDNTIISPDADGDYVVRIVGMHLHRPAGDASAKLDASITLQRYTPG